MKRNKAPEEKAGGDTSLLAFLIAKEIDHGGS